MSFLPHLFASLPSSPPREERKSLAEEEEEDMVWAEDDTDRGGLRVYLYSGFRPVSTLHNVGARPEETKTSQRLVWELVRRLFLCHS